MLSPRASKLLSHLSEQSVEVLGILIKATHGQLSLPSAEIANLAGVTPDRASSILVQLFNLNVLYRQRIGRHVYYKVDLDLMKEIGAFFNYDQTR